MANTNSPFGLRAVRRGDGAAWTSAHNTRKMQNNAGACNRGDIVKTLVDGTVAVSTTADAAVNVGVVEGFHYLSAALGYPIWTNYWPGAGALGLVDVFVIDDPNVVFEIMASAGPITLADIGSSANIVINASTTGFSKWALGAPAAGAGSDVLPFKIVALGNNGVNVGENGYDAASANNIVEVAWNAHYLKPGTLSV
jgi:hypothetical protein